jgi:hypothetical protein
VMIFPIKVEGVGEEGAVDAVVIEMATLRV